MPPKSPRSAEKEALSSWKKNWSSQGCIVLHPAGKHVNRIFNEAEEAADDDDPDDGDKVVADLPDTGLPLVDSSAGKKRGRRPLPEDLPRERVEYDLPDDQKLALAATTECIAWARPLPSSSISRSRRKFCRMCGSNMAAAIATAPMPAQPLRGSIATASTLAFALVLLDYQPGRGQVHPQTFLGDYRGILVSDGYTAWRTLHGATHVGCMAHSRRRFFKALKTRKNGGGPPEQSLRFFEQLYRIESRRETESPPPVKRRPIAFAVSGNSTACRS